MVSTRELGRLLAFAARDRAKVVLVGDHHQLPEIGAGGAFRGLADRISAAQLTQNRRQAQVWERAALAHLRRGDVAVAIASYGARGRVTMGANADVVRGQLVADWWAAHHRNSIDTAAAVSPPRAAQDARPSRSSTAPRVDSDAVMLAVRRRDVAELNARARQLMRANGKLGDDELVVHSDGVGTRAFAVGDLAVAQINDFWRSGLVNGSRGVIAAVDTTTRTLVIETAAGRHAVDALYLAAGGLDHGYALTVHKAQGLTTGQAFLLGSDALFREAGYVGLSRGRIANHLYVVGADVDEIRAMAEQAAHGPPAAADPLGELVKSLQQSRAQAMAHDQISDLPQPHRRTWPRARWGHRAWNVTGRHSTAPRANNSRCRSPPRDRLQVVALLTQGQLPDAQHATRVLSPVVRVVVRPDFWSGTIRYPFRLAAPRSLQQAYASERLSRARRATA